jgi:3-mercaptopyruvate sulfurtransferase SseA
MDLIPDVMISPATLNNWVTHDYGVDTFGYYRMVILDVDSRAGYDQGHVPGAYLLQDGSADLWATRSNGISDTPFQVPTRSRMDEIIRRADIGGDSIVVITGSSMISVSRAYFNFRYWGFPRQQLKVLAGTKAAYGAAGFALQTTAAAPPEPCQYGVCSLQPETSVYKIRASLQEMLQVAEDINRKTVIIDSRSDEEYTGKAGSTLLDPEKNSYVIFEGHIRAAVHQDFHSLLEPLSGTDPARTKDILTAAMKKINVDSTMTSFVYSRTGLEAAVTFLALDAVLNWPAKIYDGGWIQWGQMAGMDPATDGPLAKGSPWRTDIPGRSEAINYNKPHGFVVGTAGPFDSFAKQADAINRQDGAVCGRTVTKGAAGPSAPGY